MHAHRVLVRFLLVLSAAPFPAAAVGPENVAVVVNADSWASRAVAGAFVSARGIPPENVVALEDVPGYEHVGVEDFREKLLRPVLAALEERGLADIDCIAWSSDFPYAVDVQSDLAAAGVKPPQVLTPTASINGLTFLHELVLAKDPRYLDLNANWYYRRPFRSDGKGGPPRRRMDITDEERAKYRDALKLVQEKKWAEASPLFAALAKDHPDEPQLHYNLACCLAREEKPDDALKALAAAVEAGWFDRGHAEKDEDLRPLRERAEFKELAGKMAPPRLDVQPMAGFRRADRWNELGERVAEGGRRYLLSTMLAVTSGRGVSVADAVRRLSEPETGEGPLDVRAGTVYFVRNGDVRSRTREWAFASAAEKLRQLGIKAEIVDGSLPQKKDDVAGAVVGIADFDWPRSESRILPGAIVEHLTSFGGVMREHSGQTPLTAFLKHGAAGSSGTVTEPYAIQAKFPTPFLHVHYAAGATLAEAFYQSVQGPYQLLVVGDPLRQPFAAKSPPRGNGETKLPDDLAVALPEPIACSAELAEKPLEDGLLFTADGREPIVIGDLRSPAWLADQKLPPGTPWTIEAVFEATGDPQAAQFQLAGDRGVTIHVNGRPLAPVRDSPWRYYPVQLGKGRHAVKVTGRSSDDPNVRPSVVVRFGTEGTQSLDGKRFRHSR